MSSQYYIAEFRDDTLSKNRIPRLFGRGSICVEDPKTVTRKSYLRAN